jgi:hypothetical protein
LTILRRGEISGLSEEDIMKAYVKAGIKGFSGKLDGAIYCYHPGLKRTLMRQAPKMPIQPQNLDYRDISI